MPLTLESTNQLPLLIGSDPAEDGVFPGGLVNCFLGIQGGGVNILFRPGNLRLHGNPGNGQRIVAGNDLYRHPLLGKVPEGLRRIPADGVGQKKQSQRNHFFGQCLTFQSAGIFSEEHDPVAVAAEAFRQRPDGLVILPQEKFRRAQHIGLA